MASGGVAQAGGADRVGDIDWRAPWFDPWREAGVQVLGSQLPLHEALTRLGAPVRFVPQPQLPEGTAYERYIFESGQCPVRDGLHDFFNGLCWHLFPRTKSQLNRLQALEIAQAGIGSRRGPVRDAITVFDENGAVLHAPDLLWDALLAREWRRLFVDLRPLWREARLTIFGHALLEKLVAPRKDLTAHVWRGNAPLAEPDAWLAARTTARVLAAKPFTPLPVLGVPGWGEGNADFSFYDDPLVFRPRRTATIHTTTPSAGPAGT